MDGKVGTKILGEILQYVTSYVISYVARYVVLEYNGHMQCSICSKPTDNPKYCSPACRQKGWRKAHPPMRYVTGKSLAYSNMADSLNWYWKDPIEKAKLAQAVQAGDFLEVIRMLFFEDKQITFNGEEFMVI